MIDEKEILLGPKRELHLTPEELLRLDRDDIESIQFVPGELGQDRFGSFVVKLKKPVFAKSPRPGKRNGGTLSVFRMLLSAASSAFRSHSSKPLR